MSIYILLFLFYFSVLLVFIICLKRLNILKDFKQHKKEIQYIKRLNKKSNSKQKKHYNSMQEYALDILMTFKRCVKTEDNNKEMVFIEDIRYYKVDLYDYEIPKFKYNKIDRYWYLNNEKLPIFVNKVLNRFYVEMYKDDDFT